MPTTRSTTISSQRILPRIHEKVARLLEQRALLFDLKALCRGPLHLLMPELMQDNARQLEQSLKSSGLDYRIFFAHKPTKSLAFLQQAKYLDLGIDAASRAELSNALAAGFRGEDAECTGIKDESFLQLALQHRCLIVADSLTELDRIVRVKQGLGIRKKLPVLVRIGELVIPGSPTQSRSSRFGVAIEEFGSLLRFFLEQSELDLTGFHFHTDERESDIRAGQLEALLLLMIDTYKAGLQPTVINIGGGWRQQQLQKPEQWSEYIGLLEEELIKGNVSSCWRGFAYGMRLNDRGKVVGRGQAMGLCALPEMHTVISEMLRQGEIEGKSNSRFMQDNGFKLLLEPGQALLEQCGISLFEVIECKRGKNGQTFIVVDGNMYNLSASMKEYVTDPLLLPRAKNRQECQSASYIVGNLCREEDFLMKRKVVFDFAPEPGDLICFTNTAAYRMDFENATPHLQPLGNRLVVTTQADSFRFCLEDAYNPF